MDAIITVYLLSLLKNISSIIQTVDPLQAKKLLMIFIILGIVRYTILVITRNRTRSKIFPLTFDILFCKYLKQYIKTDNDTAENIWTGRLIEIISNGINTRTDLLTEFIVGHSKDITIIIASIIAIYQIQPSYSFILFIVTIIYFMLITQFEQTMNIQRVIRKEYFIERTRHLVKIIMSKFEILQNNKFDQEQHIIHQRFQNIEHINNKIGDWRAVSNVVMYGLQDRSKIITIAVLGLWLRRHLQDIGTFIAMITILYVFDNVINRLSTAYMLYTRRIVDVKKLWEFMDTSPSITGYDKGAIYHHQKGDISIQNISFHYQNNNFIFNNFSLDIIGGQKTAIVGISWIGKSTLIKLIAGYLSPQSGQIFIDGQALPKPEGDENEDTTIALQSYYTHIGYLTQDQSIFDGSILENLTYSLPNDSDLSKEIVTWGETNFQIHPEHPISIAIKKAKCEFIYDFKNTIYTQIGERGIRLSWWQKQRLAIAKIILKNPQIILLDEPTSSLDSFNEEAISQALNNLFAWRTVIIIAHRLQTVKHADEIIVLANRKDSSKEQTEEDSTDTTVVSERWTHEELVKKWWHYAKLLELQSGFLS